MDALPRTGGAFRDGDLLVLRISDHSLPNQCLITGEPVPGAMPLTFSHWAPRVSLEIESDGSHINTRRFGPLTFQKVVLHLPVSPSYQRIHHSRGFLLAVAGLGLAITSWLLWLQAGILVAINPWWLLIGCATGVGLVLVGIRMQARINAPLIVKRLNSKYVWLRGVCPRVLGMLPDWQQSSEGATQTKVDCAVNSAISMGGLVVGSVLAYFYLPTSLEAARSRYWPETAGKIVSARIESHTTKKGGIHGAQPMIRTNYEIQCEYEYTVNGQRCFGKRRSFGASNRTPFKQSIESELKRAFKVGTPVVVFFDPAHPESSTLARASAFQIAYLSGPMVLAWLIAIGAAIRAMQFARLRSQPSVPPP